MSILVLGLQITEEYSNVYLTNVLINALVRTGAGGSETSDDKSDTVRGLLTMPVDGKINGYQYLP